MKKKRLINDVSLIKTQ